MARLKNDKAHKPLSAWEIITYSIGSLGREFSNNCVSAFFLVYLFLKFAGALAILILGLGISAAQLPTISELPIVNEAGQYVESVNVFTDDEGTYLINNEETWEKISTVENAKYAENAKFVEENLISTKSLAILRVFMFLIPIPFCIAGFIIYKKKYWLYGEKYADIKKEIDTRRLNKNEENKETANVN